MDISYNYYLVAFSLLLSVGASFAALSIAARIPYIEKRVFWLWLSGGSISMGLSIWSMHFVGMLAFHINTPLAYDIQLTGLSIIYAIISTSVALFIVGKGYRSLLSLLIATFFMGSGIAAMHYTGMEALKMTPVIIYDQTLYLLSLAIAYVASFVALRLFINEANDSIAAHSIYTNQRFYSSILMGVAIAGMHYTGMEAAIFSADAICGVLDTGIESGILTVFIIMGVILIIFLTMLLLLLDVKYNDNKRLIQSERRVREVINSAPQGMIVTNIDGIILQVNSSIVTTSGFSAEELMGQPVEIIVPNHLRDKHISRRKEYIKELTARDMDCKETLLSQRKDGSQYPVEVGLSPIESGEDPLILVTIVDITDRKKLENDLIAANKRSILATDSAQIGIWEYNLLDNSVIWDEWMHRIYGVPLGEFNGTYEEWEKIVHPEDLEDIQEKIMLAIQDDYLDTKFRAIKPDGKIVWIKVTGSTISDENGEPYLMIGINHDVTHKIEREEVIWQQANFDSLTGLPNRKFFHELLELEIKQSHRYKTPLWAMFLDLDSFKEVNDTLGHDAGDKLLTLVAERIRSCIREADVVARLGGDEFAILTSVNDTNAIESMASKLTDVIAESYTLSNQSVYISTSIGIANYPNDAKNASDLLKFADQSMYVSKRKGKNRFSYFTPELQEASLKRNQITSDIHDALKNDEFEIYYQPIINISSEETYKAEALIRWRHPQKGLISPADFIPIAEETGLICDIGSCIFEKVFQQLNTWHTQIDSDFKISINMSPLQLKVSEEKYDNWLNLLEKYSLSGKQIVIEITEGLLLKSDTLVNKRLLEYRDADIQVAIDDFGTGYSSLSYLKEFDIDYLKIDQSFIRNLDIESREHSLSEAIVVMAHKLGLQVIAEGVESEKQRDLLKAMGCDYAQGYFYSKPLPVKEFEALIMH